MGFLSKIAGSLLGGVLGKKSSKSPSYGGPFTMNQGAEQAGRMHELAMRDPMADARRRHSMQMEMNRPYQEQSARRDSAAFGRRLGTGGSMGASGGARQLYSESADRENRQGGLLALQSQIDAEQMRNQMLNRAMGYTNQAATNFQQGSTNARTGGAQAMNRGIQNAFSGAEELYGRGPQQYRANLRMMHGQNQQQYDLQNQLYQRAINSYGTPPIVGSNNLYGGR